MSDIGCNHGCEPTIGERIALPLAVAGAAALGVVILATVDPNVSRWYPRCGFHAVTGCYCPGCGMTRAAHAIATGNIGEAARMNVLSLVAFPWIALVWAQWTYRRVTGYVVTKLADARLLWALAIGVTVFWVLRNLPGFEFLAPG